MDERFIAPLSMDLEQLAMEVGKITDTLLEAEIGFAEMSPRTKLYYNTEQTARELIRLLDNLNNQDN